jgi:hypothetical protein
VALQTVSEVSNIEPAPPLQVDRKTIITYPDTPEKAFVIFRLQAYNRNLRIENTTKQRNISD